MTGLASAEVNPRSRRLEAFDSPKAFRGATEVPDTGLQTQNL
jgi:hypothetical protein